MKFFNKNIFYKLNNKNFRAHLGILIAITFFFILLTFKIFGHVEIHADRPVEVEEMEKKIKEREDKVDIIKKMYKEEMEEINNWDNDSMDYYDDYKNEVEKSYEEKIKDAKENDYTME